MKGRSRDIIAGLLLAVLLVVAVVLAVLTAITTAQRVVVLTIVGVAVLWAAALHWALSRTPEGLGRLGGLPPLALDLLCIVPFIGSAVLVDSMGPARSGEASWFTGMAAGAVLMVPFFWTLRWLWWEWKRRRAGRRPAPDGPATPERDHRGDRLPGATEADGPTVG